MSKLVRIDQTGHTTLAEWRADDPEAVERAVAAFRAELDRGYFGMVSTGPGHAEQVKDLPVDADLVIMRLPISGGQWRQTPHRSRGRPFRRSPVFTGARAWTRAACTRSAACGRRPPSRTSCRSSSLRA